MRRPLWTRSVARDRQAHRHGLPFPDPDVSVVGLPCRLERSAKVEDIVAAVKEYAAGDMIGLPDWAHEEVVSADFVTSKAF